MTKTPEPQNAFWRDHPRAVRNWQRRDDTPAPPVGAAYTPELLGDDTPAPEPPCPECGGSGQSVSTAGSLGGSLPTVGRCTRGCGPVGVPVGDDTPARWCAESREGWCAVVPDAQPVEGSPSVSTVCGRGITLPGGYDHRRPTCPDCCAEMSADNRSPMKQAWAEGYQAALAQVRAGRERVGDDTPAPTAQWTVDGARLLNDGACVAMFYTPIEVAEVANLLNRAGAAPDPIAWVSEDGLHNIRAARERSASHYSVQVRTDRRDDYNTVPLYARQAAPGLTALLPTVEQVAEWQRNHGGRLALGTIGAVLTAVAALVREDTP